MGPDATYDGLCADPPVETGLVVMGHGLLETTIGAACHGSNKLLISLHQHAVDVLAGGP